MAIFENKKLKRNLKVGPRDGLQNEKTVVPTNVKVTFNFLANI